jgi:hypothetical protein
MQSQADYVLPYAPEDNEEEVDLPPTPRACYQPASAPTTDWVCGGVALNNATTSGSMNNFWRLPRQFKPSLQHEAADQQKPPKRQADDNGEEGRRWPVCVGQPDKMQHG